jgi:hypothetical protein
MQDIIQLQRATVAEHFRAENAHDWAAVHETFVQSDRAYYDVMPLSTRYRGISGVRDFYKAIGEALPDFQVVPTAEYDVPGCSIREVTCTGTHRNEYCGLKPSGCPVRFEVAVFFIFDEEKEPGRLLAERIYFDNETVLQQMRGQKNAPTGVGLLKTTGKYEAASN